MSAKISGRNILITGAGGALGSAVADFFAEKGDQIIGMDIAPGRHVPQEFVTDLGDTGQLKERAEAISSRYGHIHALIHTVGGFRMGSLKDTDEATLELMLTMNFKSTFHLCRAFHPLFPKQGGRFVAVGARTAGQPVAQMSAYSPSKAAVISLVETLAAEWKEEGHTSNCILPGIIDTPANRAAMKDADFSAWASPRDIAAVIHFLCSEEARIISGASIPVYYRS